MFVCVCWGWGPCVCVLALVPFTLFHHCTEWPWISLLYSMSITYVWLRTHKNIRDNLIIMGIQQIVSKSGNEIQIDLRQPGNGKGESVTRATPFTSQGNFTSSYLCFSLCISSNFSLLSQTSFTFLVIRTWASMAPHTWFQICLDVNFFYHMTVVTTYQSQENLNGSTLG